MQGSVLGAWRHPRGETCGPNKHTRRAARASQATWYRARGRLVTLLAQCAPERAISITERAISITERAIKEPLECQRVTPNDDAVDACRPCAAGVPVLGAGVQCRARHRRTSVRAASR